MKSNYFKADFSANIQSGPAPLTVHFQDWSFGDPDTWSWDFGDGSGSGSQDPVHTYTSPGSYTVTLTVTRAYLAYNYYREDSRTVSKPGFIQVTTYSSALQQSATPESEVTGVIPFDSFIEHDFTSLFSNRPTISINTFGDFHENLIIYPLLDETPPGETSVFELYFDREERAGKLEEIFTKKSQTDGSDLLQFFKK